MAWFRGRGRSRCGRRWAAPWSSKNPPATSSSQPPTPQGYRYVGPCRCGLGPNAFYQDAQGRIVHASQVLWSAPPENEEAGKEP